MSASDYVFFFLPLHVVLQRQRGEDYYCGAVSNDLVGYLLPYLMLGGFENFNLEAFEAKIGRRFVRETLLYFTLY